MATPMVFTSAMVRELTFDEQRFLRSLGRSEAGSGYGYPEEKWRYQALRRFHLGDRSLAAAAAYLTEAFGGGAGPTVSKGRKLAAIEQECRAYAIRDQRRPLPYLDRPIPWSPTIVRWQRHLLALPTGLAFGENGALVRLVWTAKHLSFARRGTTMVAAATLASLDVLGLAPEAIEVYQLRYGEQRNFTARDLRAMFPRLDRLLSLAEGRPQAPPAA